MFRGSDSPWIRPEPWSHSWSFCSCSNYLQWQHLSTAYKSETSSVDGSSTKRFTTSPLPLEAPRREQSRRGSSTGSSMRTGTWWTCSIPDQQTWFDSSSLPSPSPSRISWREVDSTSSEECWISWCWNTPDSPYLHSDRDYRRRSKRTYLPLGRWRHISLYF